MNEEIANQLENAGFDFLPLHMQPKAKSIMAPHVVNYLSSQKMRSKILNRIMNRIPLSTSIKVGIQSYFIANRGGSFFMPADEECEDGKKIIEINGAACTEAQPIIDLVLEEIDDFEKLHGNVKTARKSFSAYQKKINRLKETCSMYQQSNDLKKQQILSYKLLLKELLNKGQITKKDIEKYIS